MADTVPTSGPWQTDPVLRQLLAALKAKMADPAAARQPRGGGYQAEAQALTRYVDANRRRLGIPDNYTVDPRTDGQTLYDPNQNQLRDALIAGGSMAGGAYGLGAVLGSTPTAVQGGVETAGGLLPNTTPVPYSSVALNPPGAPAFGSAVAPTVATTTGASSALIDKITKAATSKEGIASLAALLPMLMGGGGGGSPFGDANVGEELSKTLALQRGRIEQAQPVYDTLVNMAYGMSPTRSRGASAPAGYAPNPALSGAYEFQAPRFGGG